MVKFFNHQLLEDEFGVIDRPGDKGAVQLVVNDLVGQGRTGVGRYAQFHARMLTAHGFERARQMFFPC